MPSGFDLSENVPPTIRIVLGIFVFPLSFYVNVFNVSCETSAIFCFAVLLILDSDDDFVCIDGFNGGISVFTRNSIAVFICDFVIFEESFEYGRVCFLVDDCDFWCGLWFNLVDEILNIWR